MIILKTVIAYIIAITFCVIISGLSYFIYIPVLSIQFFRRKAISHISIIIVSFLSGLLAVWAAIYSLSWFSLKAGFVIFILIVLGFLQNGIYRIRSREHRGFEYRHLIGLLLGIISGGFIFIWDYTLHQIALPLFIIFLILVVEAIVAIEGNVRFWNLLTQYPDEGYLFLKKSSSWYLIENKNDLEHLPKDFKWHGPYPHYVPMLGRRIKLYGKVGEYEKSQKEFVKLWE